ncbi:hypothetical protein, partial [Cellulomonas sp.]|uniref:hypothetical protein n=1 Tax=Cellulomonas sp. TaxID=40001 RepID=UPI002E31F45C
MDGDRDCLRQAQPLLPGQLHQWRSGARPARRPFKLGDDAVAPFVVRGRRVEVPTLSPFRGCATALPVELGRP